MYKLTLAIWIATLCFSTSSIAEDAQYNGPMSQHAQENGVQTCLSAIEKIDKFLYDGGGANGVSSTWHKSNSNKRGFTSFGTRKYNDGTWGYDSVHISPTQDNTCDGSLTRMVTFPNQSCAATREKNYKEWEYEGELAGKAMYGLNGQNLFLEDLTGSCIAIRSEALFDM
jgi:hypothetical protein